MFKALLKKELLQLNQFYIFNNKTKKLKSKGQIIKTVVLYGALLLFIACALGALDLSFAITFIDLGLDWLYFSLTGLIAIALGVFGDVFNTYNLLYKAKDNDLMLSMPIPPSKLLLSKIIDVYVMGMLYTSLAYLPAIVVYWIFAEVTVMSVICPIILWLVLGFLVTVLTCVLGWVIAVITSKIQGKSFTKVLATLVFLAAYYVIYFKAINKLENIAMYTDQLAQTFTNKMFLSYHLGKAGTGNLVSLLIFISVVAALFAITYMVMTRSYIKLVTTNKGMKKVKYEKKASRKSSVSKALLRKELSRFGSSSTYMLNAGIGSVVILIGAAALLIKMNTIRELLPFVDAMAQELPWIKNLVPAVAAVFPMMILSMCYISAPSISLEGKEIWVLQSLPVDGIQVVQAKLKMDLVIATLPALIIGVVLAIVLKLSIVNSILVVLCNLLYVVYVDVFGLWVDSKKYNLSWTNEVYPIKQGASVAIVLLSGWGLALVFAGIFYLTRNIFSAPVYIGCICVLLIVPTLLCYRNLTTKFAKQFSFIN